MGDTRPESKPIVRRSAMRERVEGREPLARHRLGRQQEALGIAVVHGDDAMRIGTRQDGEHAADSEGEQSSDTCQHLPPPLKENLQLVHRPPSGTLRSSRRERARLVEPRGVVDGTLTGFYSRVAANEAMSGAFDGFCGSLRNTVPMIVSGCEAPLTLHAGIR